MSLIFDLLEQLSGDRRICPVVHADDLVQLAYLLRLRRYNGQQLLLHTAHLRLVREVHLIQVLARLIDLLLHLLGRRLQLLVLVLKLLDGMRLLFVVFQEVLRLLHGLSELEARNLQLVLHLSLALLQLGHFALVFSLSLLINHFLLSFLNQQIEYLLPPYFA